MLLYCILLEKFENILIFRNIQCQRTKYKICTFWKSDNRCLYIVITKNVCSTRECWPWPTGMHEYSNLVLLLENNQRCGVGIYITCRMRLAAVSSTKIRSTSNDDCTSLILLFGRTATFLLSCQSRTQSMHVSSVSFSSF